MLPTRDRLRGAAPHDRPARRRTPPIARPRPRLLEQALFEVKKVIVGQDRAIERLIVVPARPGPRACSRASPAWPRRSPSRPSPRVVGGTLHPPAVHPRPAAGRHRRHPHLPGLDRDASTSSSGPIFANFVLADEINRAPAKVQSALLEVMAEHHVSIGGTTCDVPEPVPRAGHPEPDRDRGRLPAARGPARPLPHEDRHRLPDAGRGGRDRPPHGRATRRTAEPGALARATCVAPPGRGRRGATSTTASSTTRSASCSPPATPADLRPARARPSCIAFGASPRASLGLVAGGPGPRPAAGPQLRPAPGRLRRRPRRAAPPPRALLRGAGPGPHRRAAPRPPAEHGARAPRRPVAGPGRGPPPRPRPPPRRRRRPPSPRPTADLTVRRTALASPDPRATGPTPRCGTRRRSSARRASRPARPPRCCAASS